MRTWEHAYSSLQSAKVRRDDVSWIPLHFAVGTHSNYLSLVSKMYWSLVLIIDQEKLLVATEKYVMRKYKQFTLYMNNNLRDFCHLIFCLPNSFNILEIELKKKIYTKMHDRNFPSNSKMPCNACTNRRNIRRDISITESRMCMEL